MTTNFESLLARPQALTGAKTSWIIRMNRSKRRDSGAEIQFNVDSEEGAAVAMLFEQSEELYRHYDNQRVAFINVLLAITTAMTATPLIGAQSPLFTAELLNRAMLGASVFSAIISVIALWGLSNIYSRMKMMDEQIGSVFSYLKKNYPVLDAMVKKKPNERLSRHAVWRLIPLLTFTYSIFYAAALIDFSRIF